MHWTKAPDWAQFFDERDGSNTAPDGTGPWVRVIPFSACVPRFAAVTVYCASRSAVELRRCDNPEEAEDKLLDDIPVPDVPVPPDPPVVPYPNDG